MSFYCRQVMRSQIHDFGAAPLVVTVCGYVVEVADVTRVGGEYDGPVGIGESPRKPKELAVLEMRAPGPWAEEFRNRTLYTPPGNPWVWWTAPPEAWAAA